MVGFFCGCECCDSLEMIDVLPMWSFSHTGAFPWRPALDDSDIVAFAMGLDGETQACDATACDQDRYPRVCCLLHGHCESVVGSCYVVLLMKKRESMNLFNPWMLILYLANCK
jgi:hypothetical protein